MDLNSYLANFVNKNENLGDLLGRILYVTESHAGAIFVKNDSYNCINSINIDYPEKVTISIDNIKIYDILNYTENTIYAANFDISNNITIPIKNKHNIIGLLGLFNSTLKYNTENLIYTITPAISILQLSLNNHNLQSKIIKLEKNNEKDLFLANMSHEIRTPLNGVIGYNQLLLQTELSKIQKEYLSSMNHCSLQLIQIINDILDFGKLSSGKMNIHNECFPLKEVQDIITDAMKQRLAEKKQKCIFNITDVSNDFIILDKQKLIQILINLIYNANKFSDIGTHITVTFILEEDNLIIIVKDNGIGIKEENINKVFKPFEQVANNNSTNGTGLGLAICKKLTKLLGGNITLESEFGKGSTFIVTVKYKKQEFFEVSMKRDSILLSGKSVLVVDDNIDNRIVLTEMLFEWNMRPVVCASALEALRMVLSERYSFDIGLIDICMPGISGSELAKQIKEEQPLLPLIALSSIDSFVNTNEFEQKLDKPINRIQLFNNIHHIISKKECPSAYIGKEKCSPSNKMNCGVFDKKLRVLITEDIIYNRNLLLNILEKFGYKNVDIAENGKIAIDMIEKSHLENDPYKILLLDLRMPIMDGYEVINKHKSKGWELPHIIVVTACILEEDRDKCKDLGVEYFINKPIEMKQLKEIMFYVSELK